MEREKGKEDSNERHRGGQQEDDRTKSREEGKDGENEGEGVMEKERRSQEGEVGREGWREIDRSTGLQREFIPGL